MYCFYFLPACFVMWDLSSSARGKPMTPAVEVQSPNQWTTREIPRNHVSWILAYSLQENGILIAWPGNGVSQNHPICLNGRLMCVSVSVCGCGECSFERGSYRGKFYPVILTTCVRSLWRKVTIKVCASFPKPPIFCFVPWLSGPLRNHTNGNVLSWFWESKPSRHTICSSDWGESHLLYQ